VILYCAICIWTADELGAKHEAITVVGGHATCEEHVNYFQTPEVSFAVKKIREQRLAREGSGSNQP
jgi:hypothetical protein